MIDREQVLHVARLARLELSDEEVTKISGELSNILEHIEKIGELDLDGVPPTSHVVDVPNALRPDEPRGRHSRGSSGRRAFGTSTTCDVGGTPSRSSSPIFSMCSRMFESSAEIFVTSSSLSSRRARRATCRTCSRSIMGLDESRPRAPAA